MDASYQIATLKRDPIKKDLIKKRLQHRGVFV